MELVNASAVIVAATSDVGRACSKDLATHGASLYLIDDKADELATLVSDIDKAGGRARAIIANVSRSEDMLAASEKVAEFVDSVDILVTCPMELERISIEDSTAASWQRIVAANLLGPVFAAKAFLPALKRAGSAAIVHVGSIDGILGNPAIPSYSVSKGGIVSLTHVMASEFARFGIRVNCAARAMAEETDTPLNPLMQQLLPQTPLGRPANPREIASVVRFLASAEASYVNGVVLPVDGGRTALTPGTRPPEQAAFRAPRV